jgi:hypothetical protein
MKPVGYMAKHIISRPQWLKAEHVIDIYSVSNCMSNNFADYINYWKHNGYWFFDSPEIIRQVAIEHSLDLTNTKLFYYEVHAVEFYDNEDLWKPFKPEPSFTTKIIKPKVKNLEGYDVVTFCARANPECSPLSCNSLATEVETNEHCLFSYMGEAMQMLAEGKFKNTEPGPYRIFSVYSVPWPKPALRVVPTESTLG